MNEIDNVNRVKNFYDPNGNLIDDGVWTYKYDALNRLVSLRRKADNGLIAKYIYDPLHRRLLSDERQTLHAKDNFNDGIDDGWIQDSGNWSDMKNGLYKPGAGGSGELVTSKYIPELYDAQTYHISARVNYINPALDDDKAWSMSAYYADASVAGEDDRNNRYQLSFNPAQMTAILSKKTSENPIDEATLVTTDITPFAIDWTAPHNILLRLHRYDDTTLRITGFIDGNKIDLNPDVPFIEYYEISVNQAQIPFGRISLATKDEAGPGGSGGAETEEAETAEEEGSGEETEEEPVNEVIESPNCSQDCD
ncbi:MAG: RHS repeat protein, partial [Planctomycetes bacterium]|nr:RHS repeat protein [Planctomycetota bacterium]